MTARTWKIVVTAPCPWLTANDRRSPFAQSSLVKTWRGAAYAAAKVARLPRGLQRVRIDAVAHFRGKAAVRDTANLAPTLKAVVDGLGPSQDKRWRGRLIHSVGYGLIPDDSDRRLDGPHYEIGKPLLDRPYANAGELVLTITDLSEAVADGA